VHFAVAVVQKSPFRPNWSQNVEQLEEVASFASNPAAGAGIPEVAAHIHSTGHSHWASIHFQQHRIRSQRHRVVHTHFYSHTVADGDAAEVDCKESCHIAHSCSNQGKGRNTDLDIAASVVVGRDAGTMTAVPDPKIVVLGKVLADRVLAVVAAEVEAAFA